VCCSVLQCVAVCCSVLQYVAECCSVLQCVAVCCSVLQYVAVCCKVLQCVAVCCSVLQSVAVCLCVCVRICISPISCACTYAWMHFIFHISYSQGLWGSWKQQFGMKTLTNQLFPKFTPNKMAVFRIFANVLFRFWKISVVLTYGRLYMLTKMIVHVD